MRVFDDEEKAIIKKINQGCGYSRNLINILDSKINLQGIRIEINKTSSTAKFLFEIENKEDQDKEFIALISKQKQLTELLIKHIALLKYLEKEELAFFFEPAKSTDQVVTFGMSAVNMPSTFMYIYDQNLVNLLIKYIDKEIIPSPSLRKLEINGFLSDEDVRFKKQRQLTLLAIGVSLIIGVYGIFNNYQNGVSNENQFKQQLSENQKIADLIVEKIEQFQRSTSDYRVSIDRVSEEISKVISKANLIPESQAIKVIHQKEAQETKK